jgi:phenylacetate-CoA ligase
MAQSLAAVGHNILDLHNGADPLMRLPFLWVYGRSDYTISVMGANIYPEDLESCLYSDPELARVTRSFCQSLLESPDGDVRPCFYFEIETTPSRELEARFSKSILKHLLNLNADFREAWQEYPEILVPEIRLHPVGEGPFAADAGRIKQARILRSK